MKLIKQIYDLVNLATDKGITGYHSDSQIMDAIHEGQMMLWRDLIKAFPENKRVRNDLLPFEKTASITITAKIGSLPTDFEQEIEGDVTVSSVRYPITFKERGFFRARVLDPVDPPTTKNVMACIYFDTTRKIEIAPDITPLSLSYWKKPVKPVFSTTESGGTFLYDDATSTDVEWSDTMHDILKRNALATLGLSMRDGQVQAAGAIPKPKEATV